MNLKIESVSENAISLQIDKEDYSVADIIHEELLKVKHVKFAGVPPPHPLIRTLTIRVHTDGNRPTNSLIDAVEMSQKKIAELLKLSRQMFPAAPTRSGSNDATATVQSESGTTAQST